jgi:PIN domain nuclease of toxin-antitoxin system
MPSPFPGMDPYLEGDLWTTVHAQLAAEVVRQLVPKLRPRYVPLTQQRFLMDTPDDVAIESTDIYPDVGIAQTKRKSTRSKAVVAEAPLMFATVMPSPVPHSWVEIRDTQKRRLVTVIEFLSPTNKRGGGRKEYVEKRQKILASTAHLLEIDLLRNGKRVPMREPPPPASYFVFLSRAGQRPKTQVWPISLDHSLPSIPVPLLHPDPDVPLELQQALANVYDLCTYDLAVDYSKPPDVPLPPKFASWGEKCLHAAGFRPAM